MEKRTIIAIVLSALVLMGYQMLFPPEPPREVAKQPSSPQPAKEAAAPAVPVPAMSAPAPAGEKEIRVDNSLYTAVLSSVGGTIKSWEIKAYRDKGGDNIVLLKKPGVLQPLAIGSDTNFKLSGVNFGVSGGDLKLDSATPSGSVAFEYAGEGYSIRRTYTFYADTYKVDISDEVAGLPDYWISLGADFGIVEKDESLHLGPVLLSGTDLVELKRKKLAEPVVYRENLKWIAQEDKYFCSALVPSSPVVEARAWIYNDSPVIAFRAKPGVNKFTLYAGPKEHDRLAKLGLGLEHIVDFGFFSIIARPLFWMLKLFYRYVGNYGWAIVLITIVVRIPFIPILNMGQKSMKRLQELQPKMNEIKEKYKKDPQRMQQEMMQLYKKYKVNPMSGCFPILLQIPVFFALYKVLLVAIELRGAPFMLWITDLSMKDPYYILPIVMGITTLIQQKMTPSSMDPRQAKMMMLMPVIFTVMFLNFASGLVLYWLVNNLLGITQQIFVNRSLAKQSAAST